MTVVSPEPVSFLAGVGALWLHKQLEATEIGHPALHGAWDGLPGAEKFASETFVWDVPIDEESWRKGHNIKHHQYTNVTGRDPDIHFGPVRLNAQTPHRTAHYFQVPFTLVNASWFLFGMNLHFTGVADALGDNGLPQKFDVLPDRSPESVRGAWRRALRKYVPYYAKEYGLYPALAGPMFWKVLLGNWLAESMRDVYSAATIFCGHVGERTRSYPEGTSTRSRGEWYAMQVEASNDFEVPWVVSVLCGGLDRQIEHHLFSKLAPQRLRAIAPEVRRLCEEHGVEYRTASWPETLRGAISWIHQLSRSEPTTAGRVRALAGAMA